jgi:asparagine synthase (glutamine-hydrolysing)
MCGIGAIIATAGGSPRVERPVLEAMAESLAGRGPDACGIWISDDGTVGLVNRRLATQDARPLANQPCWSHDRRVVAVMNGEIFNHRRLRRELEAAGCTFVSNNDTEVLANAVRVWGEAVLPRLEGQFAFVCYDTVARRFLAARDSHGISPLFYAEHHGHLVLGSTPQSLFAQPGMPRRMDTQAFADFVIQDSAGDERTFFEGVSHLRAGFALGGNVGSSPQRRRFYVPGDDFFSVDRSLGEQDWVEAIREALETSVKECMLGDKEVGIYLSGGIDSLTVLALLRKIHPGLAIQTFSAGFAHPESGRAIGEVAFAGRMAKHYQTEHHEIIVSVDDVVADLGKFDLPTSSVIDSVVLRLARTAAGAGVNVALSGEGADEMFFGYDHYMAVVARKIPEFAWLGERYYLRGDYATALGERPCVLSDIFLGGGANIDWDNARGELFGAAAKTTRSVRDLVRGLVAETTAEGGAAAELDQQLIYIDYAQKVPENLLRRAEGPSMGEGVEMRFPFLSDALVRLMYRMPMRQRIGDGSTKFMLRKVMSGVLPGEALDRPKSPFGLPAARREHFKGAGLDFGQPAYKSLFFRNFARMRAMLMEGAYLRSGALDPRFMAALVDAQREEETCSFSNLLWKLWSVAEWYESHID